MLRDLFGAWDGLPARIVRLPAEINKTCNALMKRHTVQALFHVPVLGGFMVLLFSIFLVKNHAELPHAVRQGIALQIFVPLIFALGSFLRWVLWFFWLEAVSNLLYYVFAACLLAGYALMLYGALNIRRKGQFPYSFIEPMLERIAGWFGD